MNNCLVVFSVWVLVSLLAIAYIGSHPYLGLAIAILGGIVFGIVAVTSHKSHGSSP